MKLYESNLTCPECGRFIKNIPDDSYAFKKIKTLNYLKGSALIVIFKVIMIFILIMQNYLILWVYLLMFQNPIIILMIL